jgi:hypothetical protein
VSESLWELERNVGKRPKTDVSDSQDVNSVAVQLKRIAAVRLTAPILDPTRVKILVVKASGGLFKMRILERLGIPKEYTAVLLPFISAAVITKRKVPRAPCPNMHRTDVSDAHFVPSHPVCPDRTITVKATSPTPAPCTVTDVDPVPALFAPRNKMLPTSTDNAMLPVPTLSHVVIKTRFDPRATCPIRHRIDVPDSHSVPPQLVGPDRTIVVKATRPRLDP